MFYCQRRVSSYIFSDSKAAKVDAQHSCVIMPLLQAYLMKSWLLIMLHFSADLIPLFKKLALLRS